MGRTKKEERTSPNLFRGDLELKDGKMKGTYILQGTGYSASYSLSKSKPGKTVPTYPIKGTVSLRDPMTGKVVQATGAAMRRITANIRRIEERRVNEAESAGEVFVQRKSRTDDYSLSARVNSKDESPDILRSKIAERCWELYLSNEAQLTKDPMDGMRTGAINLNRLLASYMEEYLRSKKQASRKKRMLEDVGLALGVEPVGRISRKTLDIVRDHLGTAWRSKFREAAMFLDYVYDVRRDDENRNAIRDYLERNPKTIDYKKLQQEATEKPALTPDEEERLIQMATQHPENPIAVAAATIVLTDLDAAYVCKLTLGDFFPMKDMSKILRVNYHRENVAGAVHDYTFPTRPLFCEVVSARRVWLEERGLELKPETLFICNVAERDGMSQDVALTPGKLTDGIRNLLANIGVKKSIFDHAAAIDANDASGAGIKLLKGTYVKHLEECGLENDVALLKFLKHESLTNLVQANYYRSFVDPTAQYSIATALMRSRSTAAKLGRAEASVRRDRQSASVSPAAPNETLIINMRIKAKAGEYINVTVPHGSKIRATPLSAAPVPELPASNLPQGEGSGNDTKLPHNSLAAQPTALEPELIAEGIHEESKPDTETSAEKAQDMPPADNRTKKKKNTKQPGDPRSIEGQISLFE